MIIERELREELSKKNQQIENLINSRNQMQKNLGDQLFTAKEKLKQKDIEVLRYVEEVRLQEIEIANIRDMIRKTEKHKLDSNRQPVKA